MELHHKLRRDPSWHPNSCNICGQVSLIHSTIFTYGGIVVEPFFFVQLGHQAANCSTGTVNWKNMYGAKAFLIQPTIFQSDLEDIRNRKRVNMKGLEADVEQYAKRKQDGEDVSKLQHEFRNHVHPSRVAGMGRGYMLNGVPLQAPGVPVAGTSGAAVQGVSAPQALPAQDDLPAGWAAAKDSNGKVYYWHRETKKVQWQKPQTEEG